MCHIFCIHSSDDGHLSSFLFLVISNKAPMNIVEQLSFWYGTASFGCLGVVYMGLEVDLITAF